MLAHEVNDPDGPSAIDPGDHDPLETAINRRSTRSLETVMSFMAYEFHDSGAARPAAFELLEESLRLTGTDGEERRATIVVNVERSCSWVATRATTGVAGHGERTDSR